MGQKEKKVPMGEEQGQRPVGESQQQKAGGTLWRNQPQKQQQQETRMTRPPPQQNHQQQQPQHIYGFVPFRGAGAGSGIGSPSPLSAARLHSPRAKSPSAVYGTAIRPPSAGHNAMTTMANDYLHSIYAPPQLFRPPNRRPESAQNAMLCNGVAAQHQQQPMGSRPGSDLGMYKMPMPSRCQSYTSLPRPEHGLDADLVQPPAQLLHNQIAQVPFRSPSALSTSRSPGPKHSAMATAMLPPAYFGPPNLPFNASSQFDFGTMDGRGGHDGQKERPDTLASWSTISLSSWLTIVFGSAIFCLSAVRLYWRADLGRGSQELFYGISAICAGIMGVLASQHRSYCMLIAAFLHCTINAVFFVPFISGILPLIPLINSATASLSNNKSPLLGAAASAHSKELPVVDTGLLMLSLLQLAAAFSLLIYGCRAIGRTMRSVENIQIQQQQQQQRIGILTTTAESAKAEEEGQQRGGK